MKYFGWVIAFLSISFSTVLFALIYDQSKMIDYQRGCLDNLQKKNLVLEERQKNLDWFESKIDDIDEYIKWKDTLLLKGYENLEPIRRTNEEQYEERLEVIKKAIAMSER